MKKQILFMLTFLFVSQFVLADGATDVPYNDIDTLGKCDEQYFSVIKLKIKRPEAIPFTINAQGGKVEFSTGNLQYRALTNTFRFSTRQWEFVGDGRDTTTHSSGSVYWDSLVAKNEYKKDEAGDFVLDKAGKKIMLYDTFTVLSNNRRISKNYGGWIDLLGWATSGYNPNAANESDRDDPYNTCTKPYSTSYNTIVNVQYNEVGYGPSIGNAGITGRSIHPDIDTTDTASRKYDWGYFNDIYCKWVGYDTTKAEGNTGKDSIVFDSTIFLAKTWRTLTVAEWKYLLLTRKVENKKSAAWAFIRIKAALGNEFEGNPGKKDPLGPTIPVDGLLIFPDNFELAQARKVGFDPTEKDSIVYGGAAGINKSLSYKSFEALEKLGVIFLPNAGRRHALGVHLFGTQHGNEGGNVGYWASTHTDAETGHKALNARGMFWHATTGTMGDPAVCVWRRDTGLPIRLVRDLDVTQDRLVSIYQ